MLKVEIKNTQVEEKSGQFNGRPFNVRKQQAYAFLPGKPYPVEFTIRLDKEAQPYPAGNYQLAPDSLEVYQGQLQLSKFVQLVPLKSAA